MTSAEAGNGPPPGTGAAGGAVAALGRFFAWAMVATTLAFLLNDYLTYWRGWPGFLEFVSTGFGSEGVGESGGGMRGWLQVAAYVAAVVLPAAYVLRTPTRTLHRDADRLSAMAAYIVRAAFWSVLLVGLADMAISFLRIEGLLESLVGSELNTQLGRSIFRGAYVHYPLIGLSCIIAAFSRGLGFPWLALLVVIAELQIVILRFIFSYEQAFMGDLVRFWYAALFLFASAYTLVHEGHVRVDVFYAGFTERGKAWSNLIGSLVLGLPLCWVILTQGMWAKGSSINAPLLSYEISQSGFGMYIKYLMAGFLLVFAVSMIVQFCAYVLTCTAELLGRPNPAHQHEHEDALAV